MRTVRHIVTALAALVLIASCVGRPRIIPRNTLKLIYEEMFVADQWLTDHNSERRKMDTLLFYDPILKRYGYTFEDYDASVRKYLKDPEKFYRIFRDAAADLKIKRDNYRRMYDKQDKIRAKNAEIEGFYIEKDFDADTLLWHRPDLDTLSLLDSLALDSLRRDSLFRDSLLRVAVLRDSIVRDSLVRDSLLRDSRKPRTDRNEDVHRKRNLPTKRIEMVEEDILITK